jgi:hypothetical protein
MQPDTSSYETLVYFAGAVMIAMKGAIIALWLAWRNERKYRYRIEKDFRQYVMRHNKLLPPDHFRSDDDEP